MWGFHVLWPVVPVGVAKQLGWGPYHGKELQPVVLEVAVWGSSWQGCTVQCLCDNTAVVAIVNSGRSKMDWAMHLMRCLSFFLAHWNVTLDADIFQDR